MGRPRSYPARWLSVLVALASALALAGLAVAQDPITISNLSPENGSTLQANVPFTISADVTSSEVDIVVLTVVLDGSPIEIQTTGDARQQSFAASQVVGPGTHTLTVAVAGAGGESAVLDTTFTAADATPTPSDLPVTGGITPTLIIPLLLGLGALGVAFGLRRRGS